jgi:ATP-binding protein involved in chromosome partitioning
MENRIKEIEKQQQRADERMKKIKNKLLVLSGKGGVGKTTIAVNLAWTLSKKNMRVGILDVDIHGPNVPKMLGLDETHLVSSGEVIEPAATGNNLKVVSMAFLLGSPDVPVIWRGPLKMTAIRQFLSDANWGELDYLVIDAPPGTGDEPLSVCQLIKDITGAIIVTTPQEVSLLDVRKSISFIEKLNVRLIGIVENMSGFVCPGCGKKTDIFKTGGGKRIAEELKIPFLGSIPLEGDIVKASDEGKPFMDLDSKIECKKKFEEIVEKIIAITKRKK